MNELNTRKCSDQTRLFITLSLYLVTAISYAMDISPNGDTYHLESAPNNTSSGKRTPSMPFQLVGQGTMSWLWFDLYEAKLRTPSGSYEPRQRPLSLELIYARNIRREDLVKRTEDEWRRQSIEYQKNWLTMLNEIWPNISSNDKILLRVNEDGSSHFFYNDQYIGSLSDETFSHAFTAIWLSENTLKPALRNQLIGASP